jgi:hypothetical protein
MVEIHLRVGDLVRLKTNQEIGVLLSTEGETTIVFWGNGLCSEGPIEQLESIPFSPQAQITASFVELVRSYSYSHVYLREGSPGNGRFA